jgi:hypothetical protein
MAAPVNVDDTILSSDAETETDMGLWPAKLCDSHEESAASWQADH